MSTASFKRSLRLNGQYDPRELTIIYEYDATGPESAIVVEGDSDDDLFEQLTHCGRDTVLEDVMLHWAENCSPLAQAVKPLFQNPVAIGA